MSSAPCSDECVSLGVLSYTSDGRYLLRTPSVLALLGSPNEVDDVLGQAEAPTRPDTFDGSPPRPPFASGQTRCPSRPPKSPISLARETRSASLRGTHALTVARCTRVLRTRTRTLTYGNSSPRYKETTAAGPRQCLPAGQPGQCGDSASCSSTSRAPPPTAADTAWDQARDQIAGSRPVRSASS